MANKPSIHKTIRSFQLDNDIIVALEKKAKSDGASQNAVANYLLFFGLERIIETFDAEDLNRLAQIERANLKKREG